MSRYSSMLYAVLVAGSLQMVQAGIGEWKSYTAMNSVRAVASSGPDSIWAATSGGAFLYKRSDSSTTRFTNSEGLSTNDLTAIMIDRTGSVWFGQADGSIDIYSPSSHTWRYLRDIVVSTKVRKTVTSFFSSGDTLYIGTAFGVCLFSVSRFQFLDTYASFGALAPSTVRAVVRSHERVFVATDGGLAVSKADAYDMADPSSWDAYASTDSIKSLCVMGDRIYAAGQGGLFVFDATSWVRDEGVPSPVSIVACADTALILARASKAPPDSMINIYTTHGALTSFGHALNDSATSGTLANGAPVFGTLANGLALWDQAHEQWIYRLPNGPASNGFNALAVDAEGTLWCASGGIGGLYGSGFYSFDGTVWKNYLVQIETHEKGVYETLTSCFGVAIGPNDSKWISTWGNGLILLNRAGEVVRIYDTTSVLDDPKTPVFVGAPEHPAYIVPAVVSPDHDGNVWTAIYGGNPSRCIWKMKPDSSWVSYGAGPDGYTSMVGVFVDRFNTKWFMNRYENFPATPGFVFLNERYLSVAGTLDGWGMLTAEDGITDRSITSIVEDQFGSLWFGTISGITVITTPDAPTKQNAVTIIYLGAVMKKPINCIAVDPVNNKWIGTPSGVLVLSPDGTSMIGQYTVANSNGRLVSDDVLSIAFDARKGIAYFGTAKGLSSVGMSAIAPARDFSHMSAAPNPFRPWIDGSITINGLGEGSTIKILTVAGRLVREFDAQGGGRAFWDGKTDRGEPAASGIYIAVAYGLNAQAVGRTKFALIRK